MKSRSPASERPLSYEDLHDMAKQVMAHESHQCTLTTTGLVHEFYLRLARGAAKSREAAARHLPFALRVMRQILIDRARRRQTRKKAEAMHFQAALQAGADHEGPELTAEKTCQLEAALDRMELEMPDAAKLVRLRLYLDVSLEVAAEQLNISRATAYRKWNFAKAWLTDRLNWTLKD